MQKPFKNATKKAGIVRSAAAIRTLFSRYWLTIRLSIRYAMKPEAGS